MNGDHFKLWKMLVFETVKYSFYGFIEDWLVDSEKKRVYIVKMYWLGKFIILNYMSKIDCINITKIFGE